MCIKEGDAQVNGEGAIFHLLNDNQGEGGFFFSEINKLGSACIKIALGT